MALARVRRGESGMNYWPGFVDALSTLILGIIFLLTVFVVVQFYLQQEVAGKDTALSRLNVQIAQLTRRLSIDKIRAGSREQLSDEEIEPPGFDETFDRLDEALSVREALAQLSESCQEILDRFFARDESYQTIGETLEIPSGTIASRISRCLAKLREILEGRNSAPEPS